MEYKGIKLTEANGKDYQLGPNPKDMLVWHSRTDTPIVRGVLGYFNGDWVAADTCGCGVVRWAHAAEIPNTTALAEYLRDLHLRTHYYPYVVLPNGRDLTSQELAHCIKVPEDQVVINAQALVDASYTFVVLPECSDAVKEMFKRLEAHNHHKSLAAVQFFEG